MNDSYIEWFLQSPSRVSETAIGPKSNPRRLQRLFFGTHRYLVKRLMTQNRLRSEESSVDCGSVQVNGETFSDSSPHLASPSDDGSQTEDLHQENHQRHPSIRARCSCLAIILRNLSFIEENLYLANDRRVLDILQRILDCCHAEMHSSYDYHSSIDQRYTATCLDCSTMLNMDETTFDSIQGPAELQSPMEAGSVSRWTDDGSFDIRWFI